MNGSNWPKFKLYGNQLNDIQCWMLGLIFFFCSKNILADWRGAIFVVTSFKGCYRYYFPKKFLNRRNILRFRLDVATVLSFHLSVKRSKSLGMTQTVDTILPQAEVHSASWTKTGDWPKAFAAWTGTCWMWRRFYGFEWRYGCCWTNNRFRYTIWRSWIVFGFKRYTSLSRISSLTIFIHWYSCKMWGETKE